MKIRYVVVVVHERYVGWRDRGCAVLCWMASGRGRGRGPGRWPRQSQTTQVAARHVCTHAQSRAHRLASVSLAVVSQSVSQSATGPAAIASHSFLPSFSIPWLSCKADLQQQQQPIPPVIRAFEGRFSLLGTPAKQMLHTLAKKRKRNRTRTGASIYTTLATHIFITLV